MDVQSQIAFFSFKLSRAPGHVIDENGCHVYLGSQRGDGYCHITFENELGSRTSISAHRASLMVQRNCALPKQLQASHLCRNKKCVNPQHLNLESNVINNQRKTCFRENNCLGHGGYPACIL